MPHDKNQEIPVHQIPPDENSKPSKLQNFRRLRSSHGSGTFLSILKNSLPTPENRDIFFANLPTNLTDQAEELLAKTFGTKRSRESKLIDSQNSQRTDSVQNQIYSSYDEYNPDLKPDKQRKPSKIFIDDAPSGYTSSVSSERYSNKDKTMPEGLTRESVSSQGSQGKHRRGIPMDLMEKAYSNPTYSKPVHIDEIPYVSFGFNIFLSFKV